MEGRHNNCADMILYTFQQGNLTCMRSLVYDFGIVHFPKELLMNKIKHYFTKQKKPSRIGMAFKYSNRCLTKLHSQSCQEQQSPFSVFCRRAIWRPIRATGPSLEPAERACPRAVQS